MSCEKGRDFKNFMCHIITILNPNLCRKKSLKGAELFNEKGRDNILTGDQVLRLVGDNFCNNYCLMSMMIIKLEK